MTDDVLNSVLDGSGASATKSYHNGGVEGDSFAIWYDQHLAEHYQSGGEDTGASGSGGTKGSGSGGTKGSGSGGTKGSGSGGTKGSGSGGTMGSGSGGTKGSGSGGTKGSGSGGTKGSGSGGTKGSGSGGTNGSGSGGTNGSGSGGTKGSGSGGTKGSGSGGTKGSGSGGTKGSGSGGTKGSGSGGTNGSGSGGTKGSGSGGTNGSGSGGTKVSGSGGTNGSGSGGTKGSGSGGTKGSGSGGTKGSGSSGTKGSGSGGTTGGGDPGGGKSTLSFVMGSPGELTISVTETPEGQLFFDLQQTDFLDPPVDVEGIFFDLADDSTLSSLNYFPDENERDVTDIQAEADGVTGLPDGTPVGQSYDVGLQFGTVPDSSEGEITATNFTLWSDDGPLSFEDIDLSGMRVIVQNADGSTDVLGVSSSDAEATDAGPTLEDIMGLMTQQVDDDDSVAALSDEHEDDGLVL